MNDNIQERNAAHRVIDKLSEAADAVSAYVKISSSHILPNAAERTIRHMEKEMRFWGSTLAKKYPGEIEETGEQLRKLRIELGYSIEEIARVSDYSYVHIWRMEKGKSPVTDKIKTVISLLEKKQ